MMVSTTPIAIQPSSARTTGTAMRSIGGSSARMRGTEIKAMDSVSFQFSCQFGQLPEVGTAGPFELITDN